MAQSKVVVVTGGTDGIGKAFVEQYINQGFRVATCGRSVAKLEGLKAAFPEDKLLALACDVGQEEDCKIFIRKVLDQFGQIDILINNAGISMHALFEDVAINTMRKLMDVNLWGAVYCTKYALESLKKQRGIIVGITSIAGYRGLPGRSGYSASKFALIGWLEALKNEVIADGVHVMWIAPGFTKSNVRVAALLSDGSQQGASPLDESKLMTAEECVRRSIKAIDKRKRDLILTFQGNQTVWMNKLLPSITDKFVRKFFFKNGKLIK